MRLFVVDAKQEAEKLIALCTDDGCQKELQVTTIHRESKGEETLYSCIMSSLEAAPLSRLAFSSRSLVTPRTRGWRLQFPESDKTNFRAVADFSCNS